MDTSKNKDRFRESALVLLIAMVAFFSLALFGQNSGVLGSALKQYVFNELGTVGYGLPLWLLYMSVCLYLSMHRRYSNLCLAIRLTGSLLMLFSLSGLLDVGIVGHFERGLRVWVGPLACFVLLCCALLFSFSLVSNISWIACWDRIKSSFNNRSCSALRPNVEENFCNVNEGRAAASFSEDETRGSDQVAPKESLETTLGRFGIHGKTVKTMQGPIVKRFSLRLPKGSKSSVLLGLSEDIARDIGVESVRVVNDPIKSVLAIEVPNKKRDVVLLKYVLDSKEFQRQPSPLALALGVKTDGTPFVVALNELPHLLIAGTTGSGKSVALNTILISLLKKAEDRFKLIIIDPKQVEFNSYRDIPQLCSPIITDMAEGAKALHWSVMEMERRFILLANNNSRSIDDYNSSHACKELILPIIIIVDEFADLLNSQKGPYCEEYMIRLVQKARAAGIHLILATQRPSADILTPHLKANIVCRLALKVASKSNSRVILDASGAESLLGKGDSLFLSPANGLIRVHGAYMSDSDIGFYTDYWRGRSAPQYINIKDESNHDTAENDGLVDQAIAFARGKQELSTSALQSGLKVGYARASGLMDRLYELGVVAEKTRINRGRQVLIGS